MSRLRHLIIAIFLLLTLLTACFAGEATATPFPPAKVVTVAPTSPVEITELSFTPLSEDQVAINACTQGLGGVGITLRVMYNSSPQGDKSGEWRVIKELGVPCFNEIDRPTWNVGELSPGKYLVRVEAKTPANPNWENAAQRTVVYEVE